MTAATSLQRPDDPVVGFLAAMEEAGIGTKDKLAPDGRLHRFHVEGDTPGSKNGWYCLFLDGIAAGGFGSWKTGHKQKWCAKAEVQLTVAEREQFRQRMDAARQQREEEQARIRHEAAKSAASIWDSAGPADGHPYLAKKGAQPHGVRWSKNSLVVPMRDTNDQLWSLQFISPDGQKLFQSGGRKSGCCHLIGTVGRTLVIAEGYATAATIHEATGLPVAVAFDRTNLRPVAEAWREKLPQLRIIIAADNDQWTLGNPGVTDAKAAAEAVGGSFIIPQFIDLAEKPTDFNDLARLEGLDSVITQFNRALPDPAPLPAGAPIETKRQLRTVHVGELLSMEIPPRKMLLKPILPEKGIVEVYSRRGVGKTQMVLGIAWAVATGGRFLTWTAPEPRRVLLIDGEMPLITLQERLAWIVAGADNQPPDPDYLRLLAADYHPDGFPDLATAEGQEELEPFLADVDLVILDNLSTLCRSGKENEGESWVSMQGWLLSLRRRGISTLFVHHAGKGGAQRGTSKREDVLDTVIALRHPEDYTPTEGARFEVHLEKARGIMGRDAEPFEAKLETRDGIAFWTTRNLEDVALHRSAALFGDGMSVRDVAAELGISKSAAQRLRAKAVESRMIDDPEKTK